MAKGGYQRRRLEQKRSAEKKARRSARRRKAILTWVVIAGLIGAGVGLAFVFRGGESSLVGEPTDSPTPGGTPTPDPTGSPAAGCTKSGPETKGKKSFASAPCMEIDKSKTYTAVMDTSMGKVTLSLLASDAPLTVNNFVFLARNGFYDGVLFHRVIDGFMIQGGDPEGTGRGGPGYQFADENPAPFKEQGILAMANAGAGTNGSQFFITVAPIGHLNAPGRCPGPSGCHTVFGKVTAGYDVIEQISKVPRDPQDRPNTDVVIRSVTVTEA